MADLVCCTLEDAYGNKSRSADHWILTVNVIDEDGFPLLAVPTRVAVVLPVFPLLAPPPQPANPANTPMINTAKSATRRSRGCRLPIAKVARSNVRVKQRSAAIVREGRVPNRRTGATKLADVVATVTANGTLVVVDVKAIELGLKLQVPPVGRPEQARLTVPVYPFTLYAVTFIEPELPGLGIVTTGLEEDR
jgi:hypothetical protein